MRGFCVAWEDSGIIASAAAPTASGTPRAAMSRYLPIERRLPAIAANQPAITAPPTRGRRRTSSPAPISITPTSRMKVGPSTGNRRSTLGLKYRSQSTSRLVNLSAPATIGTRPYPIRNRVFASDGMLVPPTGKLRLRRVRGSPEAGALLLRHRDPPLYAAIFRPASWRVVRRDGLSLAHPDGQRPLLGMPPTTAPVAAPAPAPTFVRVFSPELAQATSASSIPPMNVGLMRLRLRTQLQIAAGTRSPDSSALARATKACE